MSRDSVRYALVAVLGGVAIALAAATFPTEPASEGPPLPGEGDGAGSVTLPVPEDSPSGNTVEMPSLFSELVGLLLLVVMILSVAYAVYNWREGLRWLAQAAVLAAVLGLIFYIGLNLPDGLFEPGEFGIGDDETRGGGGEEASDGESLVSPDPPSLMLAVLAVGAVLVVGLAALYTRGSFDTRDEQSDEKASAAAVGRVAGRAAERLENERHDGAAGEIDNEIYRAWAEMAALVDASDPETRTTAEFAAAAVEAGMDPEDVRDLTRLFEQVRYGSEDPTEADEQRAVSLFRRIESTYTERA